MLLSYRVSVWSTWVVTPWWWLPRNRSPLWWNLYVKTATRRSRDHCTCVWSWIFCHGITLASINITASQGLEHVSIYVKRTRILSHFTFCMLLFTQDSSCICISKSGAILYVCSGFGYSQFFSIPKASSQYCNNMHGIW